MIVSMWFGAIPCPELDEKTRGKAGPIQPSAPIGAPAIGPGFN
ncbi:hypothetical protein [Belnapia mucosa]|nr:hypothetical protein [Belnapia mucosa]